MPIEFFLSISLVGIPIETWSKFKLVFFVNPEWLLLIISSLSVSLQIILLIS